MTDQEIDAIRTAVKDTAGRESWTDTQVNEFARCIVGQQPRPVHAAKVGASKWSFGKALCGCTISVYTPTSNEAAKVTCPRCRKKLETGGR